MSTGITTLTEIHIIESKELLELCHKGKNLYNASLYQIRQSFCKSIEQRHESKMLFYKDTYSLMKCTKEYKELPAVAAQQILRTLDKNFKSYFKAIKVWKTNKTEFLGMPKLPNYKPKNGFITLSFPGQAFRTLKHGLTIPKSNTTIKITDKITKQNLKNVRIVPLSDTHVKVEISYGVEHKDLKSNKENCLGIDIGINNLATCVSNQENSIAVILNGKPLKSINQYFNKKQAKLKSQLEKCQKKKTSKQLKKLNLKRQNKINDYTHKASKKIIDICKENNIGTIVIGHNKEWKQNCNIGKKNTQNFVSIPFNKLIQQLQYKGKLVGMEIKLTEESYTSKTDHLSLETMEHHNQSMGKRISRGLFLSRTGKVINADVNGAIGILRKVNVVSEHWLNNVGNRGVVYSPIKINL